MSIYSELSYLFKLAEELKEIRYQDDAEEETKELCKEFNEKYSVLIGKTADGDDQIFMRDGFREINKDLIDWSKNYCNQNIINNIENFENNLEINPNNNNDSYIINNMLNNMNNDKNKNQKFREEDKINIKQSNDSSINLIKNNYMNNISENTCYNNNINNNNMINNSKEYKISNNNIMNNNYMRENNNMDEDYEESEEEEEEEEEDENNEDINDDDINDILDEEEGEEEEKEEVKVEYENQEKDDSFNIFENKINNIIDNSINNKDSININIKNDNNNYFNIDEESDDSGKNKISKIIESYNSNKKNSDSESNEENSNSDSEVGKKESEIDDFLKAPIKDWFKSLIKEGDNTKFNSKYIELNELIKNKDKMKREYKNKIITLMCIIFPFCTMDQKRHIHDSNIDEENENLELYLHETLLYFDEIDNNEKYKKLTEILNNIPKKYIKEKKNYNLDIIFDKNLFLNSKEELMLLYQFLVIYKSFGAKSKKNAKTFDGRFYLTHFYFLSFKIYFILTHQELYPCITNEIFDIFEKLLFMKIFYKNALTHKLEKPYIFSKMKSKKMKGDGKEEKEKKQIEYKYNNFILGEPKDINIEELFDKDELELNEEVIRTLKYFYKIDKNKGIDLLYFSNNPELDKNKNQYNFIINIIDLVYIKRNMILHENDKFKGNLINLEKNIKQKVSYLFKNDKKEGYCSKFAMNSDFESIYFNLIEELKKNINLENTNFYPIGSTTEFLYKNEDDLNIYLDIHKSRQKKNVLHNIYDYLKQKHSASRKINKDNCIFYFKYGKTSISLIVLGNGPYIHSLLFREYALMDPRFPIVAIALKIFLKELGIKTNNNINSMPKDSYYLNTYSFMSLLVAFLQDIISPPILPKIFSEKKSQLIPKSIPYIPELNEKKFNNFIDSIKYENINIPKIIYEKEELKKIYKEQIENNKNNLSCAEIFLHFLEFLIFYFKFDTLYVNCSLDYEGFDSMNNLINDDDLDTLKDKYPNDISFKEYFKDNYYTKRKDKEEKEINKEKGLYLIRDPVNPFHNPASSLNNYKKNLYQNFFFKLKKGYIKLLKNGNFNCLGKDNK